MMFQQPTLCVVLIPERWRGYIFLNTNPYSQKGMDFLFIYLFIGKYKIK